MSVENIHVDRVDESTETLLPFDPLIAERYPGRVRHVNATGWVGLLVARTPDQQIDAASASVYHYRVIFKPQSIIPNVDLETGRLMQ